MRYFILEPSIVIRTYTKERLSRQRSGSVNHRLINLDSYGEITKVSDMFRITGSYRSDESYPVTGSATA